MSQMKTKLLDSGSPRNVALELVDSVLVVPV
jgi:hypothetical protein